MKSMIIALGTAAALTAGTAYAQDDSWSSSIAVLEESVNTQLAQLGIDHDASNLTLSQLGELELVFSDASMSEANKELQVQQILGTN